MFHGCLPSIKVVSCTIVQSECRATANAAAELFLFQSLFREFQFPISAPPTVWYDNTGVADLVHNIPVFHMRTKHIEIDYHFIRVMILRKELILCRVPSVDQLADILTKHLSSTRFLELHGKMMVLQLEGILLRLLNPRGLAHLYKAN